MRRLAPVVALFGVLFALLCSRANQAAAVAGFGPLVLHPTTGGYTDPGDLSDLVLWLRADHVVSPYPGSKFSQWQDLENGGATYTQSTSANQFVWNASDASLGNQPSVTSTAASYLTTTATPTTPFTVYAVVNMSSVASTELFLTNAVATIEEGVAGSAWYSYLGGAGAGGTTATTGPHVTTFVMSTSAAAVYVDTSASANWSGTMPGTAYPTTVVLGYNGGSLGLLGNAAEYCVYNGAHNSTQIARAYAYFAARYSQTWH